MAEPEAPTASNSVFHNVDIVDIILQALCVEDDPEETRRLYARVAPVCHSFAYVALPVVWRQLHDFLPLWMLLLPDDMPPMEKSAQVIMPAQYEKRKETIDVVKGAKLYQATPRWRRFLRYASYVQRLDCGCYSEGEIDLLRSIVAHNKGRTFLPALRCLTWSEDETSANTLASLSSTALVELRLRYECDFTSQSHDIERVVALLPSCFPALHTFMFTQPAPTDSDDSPAFVHSLTGFKHLRSLRIDSMPRTLDESMLRELFTHLRLEELYFWIGDFVGDSEDLTLSDEIAAPYLRSLECKGPALDMIMLLVHLNAPSLSTFKFTNYLFDATPTHMQLLCQTISQLLSSTLKSLSLAMEAPFEEPPDLEMVDLLNDILHPVLSMSRLERLSFVYPTLAGVLIQVQEEDIARLARALPKLKFLEIFYDSPDEDDDQAPLPLSSMSLVHLAQHCPLLEELHLQIVHTSLDELSVPTSAPTPSHPLRLLAIRDSDFEKQARENMAGFLQLVDRLFPNLRAAGPSQAVPKSLLPDELSYLCEFGGHWKRSAAAQPRNVFVCS